MTHFVHNAISANCLRQRRAHVHLFFVVRSPSITIIPSSFHLLEIALSATEGIVSNEKRISVFVPNVEDATLPDGGHPSLRILTCSCAVGASCLTSMHLEGVLHIVRTEDASI